MSQATALNLSLAATLLFAGAALAKAPDGGASAAGGRNELSPAIGRMTLPPDAGDPVPRAVPPVASAAASGRHRHDANPLWAIPLDSLRATRERPLFSVSRRPPPAFVAPVSAPPPPEPPASEPEKPQMTLVGVVHGADQAIGIFLDRMGPAIIRLRVGEQAGGWVVRSVDIRSTTLAKDSHMVKLELPPRNAQGGAQELAEAALSPTIPRQPLPRHR